MHMCTHIHTHTHKHPTIYHEAPMKHTWEHVCTCTVDSSFTSRYTHVYTQHTHTRKYPTINCQVPMKHTCKNICALALLTPTTSAIHIDMHMYTHIHTHARKHPTIYPEAPMKHTCKNICALALSIYPSTLYIETCTCTHTYTHTHATIQLPFIKHLWNTHAKTSAHSHCWFILLLYHTSDT